MFTLPVLNGLLIRQGLRVPAKIVNPCTFKFSSGDAITGYDDIGIDTLYSPVSPMDKYGYPLILELETIIPPGLRGQLKAYCRS